MEALCRSRCVRNVQSEKSITIRTRQRKINRRSLSAAILKIRGKWRQRKKWTVDHIKQIFIWSRLNMKSLKFCEIYLETLAKEFNTFCDEELNQIRREYQLLYDVSECRTELSPRIFAFDESVSDFKIITRNKHTYLYPRHTYNSNFDSDCKKRVTTNNLRQWSKNYKRLLNISNTC